VDVASKLKKLDIFFEKSENFTLKKRIINIIHIWKNKAKEILRYKIWSVDVIKKMKRNRCQRCSSDFNLQVFQNIPFGELVERFKTINKGEGIGVYKWQKYFEKNQRVCDSRVFKKRLSRSLSSGNRQKSRSHDRGFLRLLQKQRRTFFGPGKASRRYSRKYFRGFD
jgi:hypothetical protein